MARVNTLAFLLGVAAFLIGFGLEVALREAMAGYAVRHLMGTQLVLLGVLVAFLATRTRGMALWNASLWLVGGLLAGWLGWASVLVATG